MDFEHDELLQAIQATALRVARDQTAATGADRLEAGRAAAQRAGLLELLSGSPADAAEELSPQAFCVAVHALAQADTGLSLFVWAQNLAAGAADGTAPTRAREWRSGEPVALALDLELDAGGGLYVSHGAPRGLVAGPSGWRVAPGGAGNATSVGVDGADIGGFCPSGDGEALTAPDVALGVAALASVAAGVALRATHVTAAYALERQQFGHPIADFQAIRFMLADARTAADASRLVAFAAASRGDLASAARALFGAAAAAAHAADVAVQVHGGAGYTRDYPAESLLRDASVLRHVAQRRFEACALSPEASLAAAVHV